MPDALRLFEATRRLASLSRRRFPEIPTYDPWEGKPLVEGESPDAYRHAGAVALWGHERAIRLWVNQQGVHRLGRWDRSSGVWDPSLEDIATHLGLDASSR